MSSRSSYLSDPRCQCDFVVATTQASINSGLLEYLDEETQPIQYLCFLVDEKGYPTKQISLDDLLVKSQGVNPFYIPQGTSPGDPKVKALADADFGVGVMMQMGMPAGHTPQSLPPIVTLNTASNVTFNLFCKQVKVVSIKWGRKGAIWNVFEQPKGPSGKPWSMKMSVDLTIADLDKKLNTNYFNNHPKVRDQLRKALYNISGTAFSLQQLLFDLDNASLESVPDFSSVDDEDARGVLEHFFRDIYVKTAQEHGLPLVAVTAIAQPKDESTLKMTGFERIVNHLKDGSGNPISSPNEFQRVVATLDYLCASNNNPIPRISSLDWNWVQPQDVNKSSGAISINRNILAKYIASNLEKLASSSCYISSIYPQNIVFSGNGTPSITFPSGNSNVIHMDYKQDNQGPQTYHTTEDLRLMTIEVATEVHTSYTLDVFFEGTTIRVFQQSHLSLDWAWSDRDFEYSCFWLPINKTLTDTYGISVSQTGGLQLVKIDEQRTDKSASEIGERIRSLFDNKVYNIESQTAFAVNQSMCNQVTQNMKNAVSQSSAGNLHEFQISQLQSFIFPGARVFTYRAPFFSDYQDLVCEITYLDPNEVSTAQPQTPQKQEPKTEQNEPAVDQGSTESYSKNTPSLQTDTGTSGMLTASTELMQNYVQGEVISPTGKFEALQTSDGHSLLFSCDTSGVFHAIEEQSGTSHAGWRIHDLSTTAIRTQFQSQASSAKVRTFDVGQSVVDGTIGLMMVVSLDGNDHLFTSLGNSSDDTLWISAPDWTMVPFDPVKEQPQMITITGALFAETKDGTQYLVIDIDRPDGNIADPYITRYHIDPAPSDGHHWVKHDITVDISAGQYQSVVGRVDGKHVDGIYTCGHTGGAAQLVYEPVINWYGQGPVTPITLELPGGAMPTAIATARNGEGFSDLYVVGGSSLYRFAADEQEDNDIKPALVVTSDLLVDTDTLRAMTHDGTTTLWGKSRGDEVYYLSCETSQLHNPNAWRPPFPILSGVERMSSYVNRVDGGNTIFAAGNGRLQKIIQGPAAAGGIWRSQEITVAAPPEQKCTSFKSYTTTIHVKQKDQNLPASNIMVSLSAHGRTPVYINGLYYVLLPAPIQVATDTAGSLTIIDSTDSLHAAVLTASLDSTTTITINPMDKAMDKLTALDSFSKLRGAQFPSRTVAGGVVGSSELTHLIDPSVNDDDVAAGAQLMGILKDSYARSQKPAGKTITASASMHSTMLRTRIPHTTRLFSWGGFFGGIVHGIESVIDDIGDAIKSLAGDVLQWAKKAAEGVGQIFKDVITGALHLFAKIGGKVYHAVLDTVHAVVGAVEWVYSKIKAGIKELIAFIEMLFGWDDIRRTKDVMHNAIKLWAQYQVGYIPKAKGDLNENIDEFKERMKEWTGNTDLSPLHGLCQNPAGHNASNPNKDQTSASKFLATHYQNHAHQVQLLGDSPTLSSVEQFINNLLAAMSQEGTVLEASFNQLTKLANDFANLSVEEVLKRVAGILTEATLSSVQVVADALLTVLHDLAQSAITILDTKIRIPIISDLLKDIVPELSFLDLICWIAAMGFTVVYKLVEQTPPFPKGNEYVQAIISAGSWEELEKAFGQSDLSLTPKLPLSIRKPFFRACHGITAFLSMIGNPISSAEAASEASIGILSKGSTVIKLVMTGVQTIGDELVPRYPVKNSAVKTVSHVTSVLGIMSSIVFSSVAQSGFKAVGFSSLSIANPRGVGAVTSAILVLPRLVVTGWHFHELTKDNAGETLTAAVLGEVSNLSSYVSKVSYAVAVNDQEPDSRLIAVTIKVACDDIFSGLQAAESITGYS